MIINYIVVALGGAVGSVLRYLVSLIPLQLKSGFPVKTLLINIVGSLLIGIIAALSAKNAINPRIVTFIKAGICGGFTTFSSFALETDQLINNGQMLTAIGYVTASILFGVASIIFAEKLLS